MVRRLGVAVLALCVLSGCANSPAEVAVRKCAEVGASMSLARTQMLDAKAKLDRLGTRPADDPLRLKRSGKLEQRSQAYAAVVLAHRSCAAATATTSPSPG